MAEATPTEAATSGGGMDGTALVWTVVFLFVVAFCCGACACHALRKRMKLKRRYSDDELDEGRGSGHHYSVFGPRYEKPSHSHETPGHPQKTRENEHEIDKRRLNLDHEREIHEQKLAHERAQHDRQMEHEHAMLERDKERHATEHAHLPRSGAPTLPSNHSSYSVAPAPRQHTIWDTRRGNGPFHN